MILRFVSVPSVSLAICLAIVCGDVAADTVWIEASRDNTLIETADGSRSNGSGPAFHVGNNSEDFSRRGTISFEIAGRIPRYSEIVSVRLVLFMSQTSGGAAAVSLHRLSAAWGEGGSSTPGGNGSPSQPGDATWLHNQYPGGFWAGPGGDFVASSASTIVDQSGQYEFGSTGAMIADVRSWLAEPTRNHGWLLRGDESRPTTAKRFHSREHPDARSRPLLVVEFENPPLDAAAPPDRTSDDNRRGAPNPSAPGRRALRGDPIFP